MSNIVNWWWWCVVALEMSHTVLVRMCVDERAAMMFAWHSNLVVQHTLQAVQVWEWPLQHKVDDLQQ